MCTSENRTTEIHRSQGPSVDYGPVQEWATLCNDQENEIAVAKYSELHMGTGRFVAAKQVFWSLMTSRTGPSSTASLNFNLLQRKYNAHFAEIILTLCEDQCFYKTC